MVIIFRVATQYTSTHQLCVQSSKCFTHTHPNPSYNKSTANATVAETENYNKGKGKYIKSHRKVETKEGESGERKAVKQH